jgi:transcriptional regulator with XRE-family HTH domain
MRLRTFLDAHGESAERFAHRLGVSSSVIYKYRTGARSPSEWLKLKIAKLTKGQVGIFNKDWPRNRNRNDLSRLRAGRTKTRRNGRK